MHRVLYDAGVSPFGLVENLDRLGISPDTFQAIVLSHGHFDHVAGLHGLIKRIGGRKLPVLLHPDFWSRRRIASPDRFVDLPTPSRAAIEDAGFALIEDRQPSFLLGGVLLVTGEVPRTTAFETGLPARSPGMGGWPVAARPAGPRRPGAGGARPRPGTRGHHRVRPRRHRQHRPPGETAHRRRPDPPGDRRSALARRPGAGGDGGGADRGTATTHRARPLHQLAGPSRPVRGDAAGLPAELGRQPVRAVGRTKTKVS